MFSRRFYKFVLLLLAVIVLSLAIIHGITYLQIHQLPQTEDPIELANTFSLVSVEPKQLEVVNVGLFWVVYSYTKSSFFPYKRLDPIHIAGQCRSVAEEDKGVISLPGETKQILVDRYWNVFWIEVFDCRKQQTRFFGPYRSPIDLNTIREKIERETKE